MTEHARRSRACRAAAKEPLLFIVSDAAITFRLTPGFALDAKAVERRHREDRRRATAAQLIACRRMASVRLTDPTHVFALTRTGRAYRALAYGLRARRVSGWSSISGTHRRGSVASPESVTGGGIRLARRGRR